MCNSDHAEQISSMQTEAGVCLTAHLAINEYENWNLGLPSETPSGALEQNPDIVFLKLFSLPLGEGAIGLYSFVLSPCSSCPVTTPPVRPQGSAFCLLLAVTSMSLQSLPLLLPQVPFREKGPGFSLGCTGP